MMKKYDDLKAGKIDYDTYKKDTDKLMDDYYEKKNKNVEDYLNRDKLKDKLNYNENTDDDNLHAGTFRKKESRKDPYDDPESNESQRLQDIQMRYDDYLQKTEGRGASYGEIAYVDGLRGKDLDNFEKELDDFEEKESNKSTNETMNNAIREKASKKTKTEISSNNKFTADEEDILEGFGEDYGWDNPNKLQNLKEQIDYMRNPNESIRQTAKRYATGGSGTMLIYTGDAEDYLKERGIKYDKDDPFETYANVMAEKIESLYNKANDKSFNDSIREKANIKNEWKQYLKDHPESKMSLSKFKNMKK